MTEPNGPNPETGSGAKDPMTSDPPYNPAGPPDARTGAKGGPDERPMAPTPTKVRDEKDERYRKGSYHLAGRCNSRLRRKPGFYCWEYPIRGKTRCNLHGAKSPGPKPKDPRDLKHPKRAPDGTLRGYTLPERMMERYERASRDADWTTLREQFLMIDALLQDQLTRLGSEIPQDVWKRAVETYKKALETPGPEGAALLKELGAILKEGQGAARAEADTLERILELTDSERRIVVAESRMMQVKGMMVPLPQVLELVSNLLRSVTDRVSDASTRREIALDFARLTGLAPEGASSPKGGDSPVRGPVLH